MLADPQSDSPFSKEDLAVVETFKRSKIWRVLRDALAFRREQIFNEKVENTGQLWKKEGRLEEIQWILSNAGLLMIQYEAWRRAEKKGRSAASDADSGAETPELPGSPTTYSGF